ncbi:polyprenyl synthetase family protein [Candidatus Micrarchaeota archaeon]|nr:polyprenyl synthetase family protein [Candidatus Micrarchaeota archaeon]MBU1165886.1 polyprenyl synthetase family protein [Candidatus Micrarchaeota archaeon]
METGLSTQDERVYGLLIPFLKRGGKRIRPSLCFICCGAVGGRYGDVVEPASIIELFHNFTLVHDDIEDDSQFRRGEPTLHVSYGIPMALNSGDALYTFLWERLVSLKIDPDMLLQMQKLYARSFKRVVDGQGVELSWIKNGRFDITEEEYLTMINGKTSALMGLSCEIGAFVAKANSGTLAALRDYGEKIGTAFQVQDDVLNITGNFDKYKKEIGGDISEGKRTLMVVHCLERADNSDKKKLIEVLSSHSKKQGDINVAIHILNKYDSITYAKNISNELIADAKLGLSCLKPSVDKDALLAIADYVVKRES